VSIYMGYKYFYIFCLFGEIYLYIFFLDVFFINFLIVIFLSF